MVRRSAGVLVALLISAQASAQPRSADPTMPVTFRAENAGAELRVQGPGIATNAGSCPAACTLNVLPGNFVVYFTSGSKTTQLNVTVLERSEVVVSPANSFQRGLGLGLIIGGGTVAAAGAFALYYDLNSKLNEERYADVDPSYNYSTPDWVLPTEIAGAVGLGVATVGTVLFLTATPSLEVLPQRTATLRRRPVASQPSRFQFVPTLGPRGGGAHFGLSF